MMDSPRIIAFDSCTILHLLSETQGRYEYILPIYKEALAGRLVIVLSEISVAECVRLETGVKTYAPEESARIINGFFLNPHIRRRAVTSRESELAQRLILKHSLGTCDGLIAATAAIAGADTLYTTDGCTNRRKAGKLLSIQTIDVPGGSQMAVKMPDGLKPQATEPVPQLGERTRATRSIDL
jgi:predicted nucleic acid-binding protein